MVDGEASGCMSLWQRFVAWRCRRFGHTVRILTLYHRETVWCMDCGQTWPVHHDEAACPICQLTIAEERLEQHG